MKESRVGSVRERERERERQRETERDRERQRETERDRERPPHSSLAIVRCVANASLVFHQPNAITCE